MGKNLKLHKLLEGNSNDFFLKKRNDRPTDLLIATEKVKDPIGINKPKHPLLSCLNEN